MADPQLRSQLPPVSINRQGGRVGEEGRREGERMLRLKKKKEECKIEAIAGMIQNEHWTSSQKTHGYQI